MPSPDTHIPQSATHITAWESLFAYGISLKPASRQASNTPMQIQMANARVNSHMSLSLLRNAHTHTNIGAESDEHPQATTRRAVAMAKHMYDNLPPSLCVDYGVLSAYMDDGEAELDTNSYGPRVLADMCLEKVIMNEIQVANGVLQQVVCVRVCVRVCVYVCIVRHE